MVDYFKEKNLENTIAVAPDVGAVKRVRSFAESLDIPLAIVDKKKAKGKCSRGKECYRGCRGKKCYLTG